MKAFQKKLWLSKTHIKNKTAVYSEVRNKSFNFREWRARFIYYSGNIGLQETKFLNLYEIQFSMPTVP